MISPGIGVSTAGSATIASTTEQHQITAETLDHHLGRVALLTGLVGPLARLQLTLEVDRAALGQETLGDIGEVLVEDHDTMPLGLLALLAGLIVSPALRCGDVQGYDLLVVLGRADLGIAAEVAEENHLVDAAQLISARFWVQTTSDDLQTTKKTT